MCVCVCGKINRHIESTSRRRPTAIALNRLHLSHRLVSKQNEIEKYVVRSALGTRCRAVHTFSEKFEILSNTIYHIRGSRRQFSLARARPCVLVRASLQRKRRQRQPVN